MYPLLIEHALGIVLKEESHISRVDLPALFIPMITC